jgi:hypothetical protein
VNTTSDPCTDPTSSPTPTSSPRTVHALNLSTATDRELLVYALTLGDDDPILGALQSTRRDLGMLADLGERTASIAGMLDLGELGAVLEGLGHRMDVAIELLRRRQDSLKGPSEQKADALQHAHGTSTGAGL